MSEQLTRVAIFYDGNYFSRVSNFYNYEHKRKSRLSISGLHNFVKTYIAEAEEKDSKLCALVDAHYFRGRFSSHEAKEANKLLSERLFDDVLMNEGIITHYLPLRQTEEGRKVEKGVDVTMALEIMELSYLKKYDVVVLVVCDGDFQPLIKKLNTHGIRVMVLAWDFEFVDERTGRLISTTTSIELLREANYPVLMHEIIDNKANQNKGVVNDLFIFKEAAIPPVHISLPGNGGKEIGTVFSMKDGYGFITKPPHNLFFHWTEVSGADFNELNVGDQVEYKLSVNDKGQEIATEVSPYTHFE